MGRKRYRPEGDAQIIASLVLRSQNERTSRNTSPLIRICDAASKFGLHPESATYEAMSVLTSEVEIMLSLADHAA